MAQNRAKEIKIRTSLSRLFCPTRPLHPDPEKTKGSKKPLMNRFQIKCANRMINVPFAGRFSPQFYTPVATVHHQSTAATDCHGHQQGIFFLTKVGAASGRSLFVV